MTPTKNKLRWTTRAIEVITVTRRTDFTDPETKGLSLRVTPAGAKSWSLLYRRKGDAKKRRVTLGEFPAISLADARAKAEANKVKITAGSDPAGNVADYKKADTVDQLLDQFLEKHPRPGGGMDPRMQADIYQECPAPHRASEIAPPEAGTCTPGCGGRQGPGCGGSRKPDPSRPATGVFVGRFPRPVRH